MRRDGQHIVNDFSRPLERESEDKSRLNLNDLLKRRQEEKRVDKKINILILSGATAVASVAVIVAVLNL